MLQMVVSWQWTDVFDIDGNGWSSRFHRLIMSGSVVLKATIYPEWVSEWLTPWVHYVVRSSFLFISTRWHFSRSLARLTTPTYTTLCPSLPVPRMTGQVATTISPRWLLTRRGSSVKIIGGGKICRHTCLDYCLSKSSKLFDLKGDYTDRR